MLISNKDIEFFCQVLRAGGKKVVFTNGCFDILHAGHVRYLAKARSFGDCLVLGLNSDASVRRLKGPERPINNEQDRAEVVGGLQSVDYVVIFDEPTAEQLIAKVKP
ncbi:MAG: adenylyltransferase/cytidyltransferase family protein, partial [Selenomonadaceae bacterium]|nr:adenylyltransferase/cytidyltransferase family protein [Selenomonadaceae bacterium]